tara:strand:+ start:216 stop:1442 length:1227 start_codon:yes stop_codon:yes gene_type:complete
MASTYTPLGVELMVTGENAGTWGTKTNTNLQIIEQISGGYITQAIAGSGTTAFTESDGSTGSLVASRVIIFTGALTGSRIVTFPVGVENFYLIKNGTTGTETLQLKAASGSGATVTWATDDKGWKLVYFDGVASNTGVYDTGFSTTTGDVTLTGTQTLTNKTLTSPKIGTSILDTNGNELMLLTATGSAVNEITIANAGTGVTGPVISATGETNVGINVNPKGTGVFKSGGNAVKLAGTETMWIPAVAMYAATSNGCGDIAQTELTAQRPEVKALPFDASSDEYAQFAVAMPKSWDEGTVTFQSYWSVSGTNTGTVCFAMQGVAVSSDDTLDEAMGTAVPNTALAASGTANDLMVNAVSGAVTIGGSPAAGDEVFFNIFRDVSADDQTADARLLGVKLFYTTDAANDA